MKIFMRAAVATFGLSWCLPSHGQPSAKLFSVGWNPIKECSSTDIKDPAAFVILHIPSDILSQLDKPAITCPGSEVNHSCVVKAGAVKQPVAGVDTEYDYKLDPHNPPMALGEYNGGSTVNWPTRLDIDLYPFLHATNKDVIVKIVLDNTAYTFAQQQNANATQKQAQAILAGDEGHLMFRCSTGPKQDDKNRWFMRVRVMKYPGYGGLNIGILVPEGSGQIMMPIYIDPQFHNDG